MSLCIFSPRKHSHACFFFVFKSLFLIYFDQIPNELSCTAAQTEQEAASPRSHLRVPAARLTQSVSALRFKVALQKKTTKQQTKGENQTVNFLCIKQFYYITMGKYTRASSVAINSQHQVLECTRSHKPNKTKQRKRNLYLLNACYTSAEKRNIFTGLWHRTLPALSSPSSTLAHPAPPISKWGKGVGANVAGGVSLPLPDSFKKQTKKGKKGRGFWKAGSWPEAYKVLKAIRNYIKNL